jgi:hypothetical protein
MNTQYIVIGVIVLLILYYVSTRKSSTPLPPPVPVEPISDKTSDTTPDRTTKYPLDGYMIGFPETTNAITVTAAFPSSVDTSKFADAYVVLYLTSKLGIKGTIMALTTEIGASNKSVVKFRIGGGPTLDPWIKSVLSNKNESTTVTGGGSYVTLA